MVASSPIRFPVKLQPARHDPRTLKLSRYKLPAVQAPTACDYSDAVADWLMFKNDSLGNCAIVGPAHQEMGWTFLSDVPDFTPTLQQVLDEYTAVSGFNQATGANDNGCVLLDVMNRWNKVGLFGGRKIDGFVGVTPSNHEMVAMGIYLFGSLTVGLRLPLAAQTQDIWTAPSRFHRRRMRGQWAPDSWGGHCVELCAYDAEGVTAITWGAKKKILWDFIDLYCDEGYNPLSPDWMNKASGDAPNKIAYAQLTADLQQFN